MNTTLVNNITPFVPSKDFELSLCFYKALGFEKRAEIKNAVRLEINGFGFWLQNYYVKEWADNFMLCLYVENLEFWWSELEKAKINDEFKGAAKVLSVPHPQEGAMMMQISDPSGVLWHIREGT